MTRVLDYIVNGGTERDRLLAEADYCAACAQREADMGDPIGMYAPLAEEAFVLRRKASACDTPTANHEEERMDEDDIKRDTASALRALADRIDRAALAASGEE